MAEYVLDASAVLTLLQNEPGAADVAATLGQACISSVNVSEVVAKLVEHGINDVEVRQILQRLDLQVIDFDTELAFQAGALRAQTKRIGLSLGDRACLALGIKRKATVVTSDRVWKSLTLGIVVRVVRR